MFPENRNQFIGQIDMADLFGFGGNDLAVNAIDSALHLDVLSVEIDITGLKAGQFAQPDTGMDRSEEQGVMFCGFPALTDRGKK